MLQFFLKRRKVSNYLASTRLGFNYHFALMVIALLSIAPLMFYLSSVARQMILEIGFLTEADPLAAEQLLANLKHILVMISLGFFIFFLMALAVVLILEQRVGGPTVALLKFIEELKSGNYDYNRSLRKKDELVGIMDALKGLRDQLKEKK